MIAAEKTTLLRGTMMADAVTSGATGLLLLAGAGVLAALLGMPAPLMRVAGLILLPFAGLVLYFSAPSRLSRPAVATVIVLNVLWVAASIGVLASGWIAPTALGTTFVILQAAVVAIFAELQYTGLRRARA